MTETTQHTPADVRERVAFEAFAWEHGRRGADAEWIRAQWQSETPKWRAMYFDLADRILAILRTPRGEEEAEPVAAMPDPCLSVPCPLCRAPAGEPCHEITRERAERWAYRVIFGRCPGDETDEEIDADMAEMERCHSEGGGDDV